MQARDEAKALGIPHFLVVDSGCQNFFNGSPTVTALGLGPARRAEINHVSTERKIGQYPSGVVATPPVLDDLQLFKLTCLLLRNIFVQKNKNRLQSFSPYFSDQISSKIISGRVGGTWIQMLIGSLAFAFTYVKWLTCPWINQCVDIVQHARNYTDTDNYITFTSRL
jgi:hypothetical protein